MASYCFGDDTADKYARINKDSELNRNYTQRTRSFLYATVARMQGLDLMRFCENGVVTNNLPVIDSKSVFWGRMY